LSQDLEKGTEEGKKEKKKWSEKEGRNKEWK
jgi:hypothetical protein